MQPKITPIVYVIIRVASQNHMHESSSENYIMVSNAPACPNCSIKYALGVFQHAESTFAIRFAHSSNTSFNATHSFGKKSVENTSWKTILSHLRRGNWPIRELLALHCELWPEYNMQIHILFALAVIKYFHSF